MSAYRRFILFFCLIAITGCNNGNQEDETDTDTQNACSDCLPAEGLPQLGSVDILEFPNNATSECEGVCIGTIDGPGECWFPREPEKTCDKKLKGIQTEVLLDSPFGPVNTHPGPQVGPKKWGGKGPLGEGVKGPLGKFCYGLLGPKRSRQAQKTKMLESSTTRPKGRGVGFGRL